MVQSQVGKLVCVTNGCPVAGYPTTRSECVSCHQPTRVAAEVRASAPAPRPVVRDGGQRVMDMTSRVIFGGFWSVVTVAAVVAGAVLLSNGQAGGLLAFGVAILTGLYARYIFRGGRFRILFW